MTFSVDPDRLSCLQDTKESPALDAAFQFIHQIIIIIIIVLKPSIFLIVNSSLSADAPSGGFWACAERKMAINCRTRPVSLCVCEVITSPWIT